MCHITYVTCHVSHIRCQVSGVICQVSPLTSRLCLTPPFFGLSAFLKLIILTLSKCFIHLQQPHPLPRAPHLVFVGPGDVYLINCPSKCVNNFYAIRDKITINHFCYRLSQTVCVCPRQSVFVPDSLCLSHTGCVCHRQSVYLRHSLCLSETVPLGRLCWPMHLPPPPPTPHIAYAPSRTPDLVHQKLIIWRFFCGTHSLEN